MFEAFQPTLADVTARRRTAASTAAATATYVLIGVGVLILAGKHQLQSTEKLLEVSFERALPKLPPPPPPPPKIIKRVRAEVPQMAVAAPPPPSAVVPKEMPKEAPPEAEPTNAPAPAPVGAIGGPRGAVGGVPEGTGTAPVAHEASAPVNLPEDADPPQALTEDLAPNYPEAARAAGLEGVVILKFVVTREGTVADIKVLKGEPPFVEAAIAKVKTLTFKPAMLGGSPIAVFKIMKFPFRLSVGG